MRLDEGFAGLSGRVAREMSFFFPIPERSHPRLEAVLASRAPTQDAEYGREDAATYNRTSTPEGVATASTEREGRPFAIGRGVVRGVIDLVFEHAKGDGPARTYFLDWKSDRVPGGEGWGALEQKVRTSYALQARLYTLGVLRLLGIRDEAAYEARFGGLLYCFLRAMGRSGDSGGVVFERPSFEEVVAWERELREHDAPWGYPIRPIERSEG